jgi:hypothetical protein
MNREAVSSSNIITVGYDSGSETLEIEFKSGAVYQYYNVSEHLYEQFKAAPSKGQFFHIYIKDAVPFSRV